LFAAAADDGTETLLPPMQLRAAAIAATAEDADGDGDASSNEQFLAEASSLGERREARLRLIVERRERTES
jgi:hypothetical protein